METDVVEDFLAPFKRLLAGVLGLLAMGLLGFLGIPLIVALFKFAADFWGIIE